MIELIEKIKEYVHSIINMDEEELDEQGALLVALKTNELINIHEAAPPKLRPISTAPPTGDVLGVIKARNEKGNIFLEVLSVNVAKPTNEEDRHFTHHDVSLRFHPNRDHKTTDFELLGWLPSIDVNDIEL